jgi:hypothetical protein
MAADEGRYRMILPLLFAATLALAGPMPLAAQESGEPLSFTVRPYRAETEAADARARQERLIRRRDESEFALRSICRSCSRGLDQGLSSVPFDPLATLNGSRPSH